MSILAANELTVTSSARTAKTGNTRLSCFISILLSVVIWLRSSLHDLDGVSIRVADRDCFPESRLAIRQLYSSGRAESGPAVPESLRGLIHADPQESGLPVDQVIGLFLRRVQAPVLRRQVFKKFDAWPRFGFQCCNVQPGSEDIVEALLLGAVIFTFTGDFHSQPVPIKLQA